MNEKEDSVARTRNYYDSTDADVFYRKAWGEEHIHLGIFKEYYEPMEKACQRTIRTMAKKLGSISKETEILDIGSGYGGTARYLVTNYGCHVYSLNLSEVQNKIAAKINRERNLEDRIEIVEGSFEEMPFDDESMDVCWSVDALLHSGNRKKVIREAARVLRHGGDLVFTDPMRTEDCPRDVLDPILERVHLSDLGSLEFYRSAARDSGMEEVSYTDYSPDLQNTYGRVLEYLDNNEEELTQEIDKSFLDHMAKGLRHWVDGGNDGYLKWGILHFRKK